jgi:hypothetical protein
VSDFAQITLGMLFALLETEPLNERKNNEDR